MQFNTDSNEIQVAMNRSAMPSSIEAIANHRNDRWIPDERRFSRARGVS